ncbi:MAG: transglycosylase SLT domain-containing protein [Gammaproteobacteria bacterium]|nr:transglycosylase SLT domain-containing protein [Gammaproteobacteria bacterium]MCG3143254.1 Soluble lytic murein transglycosylase [Gammaproteobacteria bacterium]
MRVHRLPPWRRRTGRVVLLLCALTTGAAGPASAAGDAVRAQFRRAYSAFQSRDFARGESLSAGLEDYLLYPHLQYESLRHRLDKDGIEAARAAVRQFLADNAGTMAGERLRTQWLTMLARQERWTEFLADYAPQQKIPLRCAHVQALVAADSPPAALEAEAFELWMTGVSLPPACDAVDDWLGRTGALTADTVLRRLGLALDEGNTALAQQLARALPEWQPPLLKVWQDVASDPQKHLGSPLLRADTPVTRAIVRSGVERLARRNAGAAATEWQRRHEDYQFSSEERGRIAAGIAMAAVRQERSDALAILDEVPEGNTSADLQRAQLMAALEHRDWNRITRWTTRPAADDMNASRWLYWRARALQQLGRQDEAETIFRQLVAERDYYGLMSAGILGAPYSFNHRPLPVSAAQVASFLSRPGIERARELHVLELDAPARAEWTFEIASLDRQGLMEAAAAAHRLQWYDRAIASLGKAREYDDLEVRFPLGYTDVVERYARERNLEPAVMLSFIRSESAFNEFARSPAGALGLMQVMPATGKLTARRIGLSSHTTADLLRAQSNVMIGSAYLRDMLDRHGGNLAMAAAAYNAGPLRVKKWRPLRDCIEADIWVDTIPFTETRRYVRNILFYTALYEMRLQEKVRPLRERVAYVAAESTTPASCDSGPGLAQLGPGSP